MPEPRDPWVAQHNPNKITTAEKNNWVSSAQSRSEESESIEQTFMNKGVVPQETKDEKTISRSGWKRTFNLAVKDSNYLGKMTMMKGSQKAEKVKITN